MVISEETFILCLRHRQSFSDAACCLQGQAGTNGANDLSELLGNRPDAVNPIIGYNVLPASYNLAALTPGKSLDTTDTAKSGNTVQGVPETLVVNVTSNSGTGAQVSHCMLDSPL